MSGVLAAADLVVLPSRFPDPLPLLVLEALASGTPIVASAVGGIPEMLTGPFAANLVPAGDADALAARIRALRDWRTRTPELAELGRRHVETGFSLQRMGESVNATIEQAVPSSGR
jgi:glycosyltransferase involved in cell wall biosynthesis